MTILQIKTLANMIFLYYLYKKIDFNAFYNIAQLFYSESIYYEKR